MKFKNYFEKSNDFKPEKESLETKYSVVVLVVLGPMASKYRVRNPRPARFLNAVCVSLKTCQAHPTSGPLHLQICTDLQYKHISYCRPWHKYFKDTILHQAASTSVHSLAWGFKPPGTEVYYIIFLYTWN